MTRFVELEHVKSTSRQWRGRRPRVLHRRARPAGDPKPALLAHPGRGSARERRGAPERRGERASGEGASRDSRRRLHELAVSRVRARSCAIEHDARYPGRARFFVRDPFGNRIEAVRARERCRDASSRRAADARGRAARATPLPLERCGGRSTARERQPHRGDDAQHSASLSRGRCGGVDCAPSPELGGGKGSGIRDRRARYQRAGWRNRIGSRRAARERRVGILDRGREVGARLRQRGQPGADCVRLRRAWPQSDSSSPQACESGVGAGDAEGRHAVRGRASRLFAAGRRVPGLGAVSIANGDSETRRSTLGRSRWAFRSSCRNRFRPHALRSLAESASGTP